MPESKVHSFIVKLWLEEAADEARGAGWHGYITHVPSGERRYLRDLQQIVSFVKSYIATTSSEISPQSQNRPRG